MRATAAEARLNVEQRMPLPFASFTKNKRRASARRRRQELPGRLPKSENEQTKAVFDFLPGHPEHNVNQQFKSLTLPPHTTYSLALLGPSVYCWKEDVSWCEFLFSCFKLGQRCYLLHLYNLLIQGFILWEIRVFLIDADSLSSCDGTSRLLKFVCLSIFSIAIISDLHETLLMLDWLWYIKEVPRICELRVMRDSPNVMADDVGLTRTHKVLSTVFVLLPKFVFAIVLWTIGTAFITSAPENSQMIIDMLALSFVTEIDEIIFSAFTTQKVVDALEALPEVMLSQHHLVKVAPELEESNEEPPQCNPITGADVHGYRVRTTCTAAAEASCDLAEASKRVGSCAKSVTVSAGRVTATAAVTATQAAVAATELTFYYKLMNTLMTCGLDKIFVIGLVSGLAYGADAFYCS